ncbi:MAG TPA: response regulator [Blastocatellia bacterium]|nr:response regulator [Blastocatellia bacterium]
MNKPFNILCVDDHGDSVTMLKVLLEMEGYNVTVACSGYEALEILKTQHFDLHILDIHMPDMSGLELCGKLREHDQRSPIILYSAGINDEQKKEGYKCGVTMFIAKPEGLETIIEVANAMRNDKRP